MNVKSIQAPPLPSAPPEAPVGMESAVEAALLRLEDEASSRRSLARKERRRALDRKLDALQRAEKSSRTKMITGFVTQTVQLAASAASAAVGAAGDGSAATTRAVEGISKTASACAELAGVALTHRSNVQELESNRMSAGAGGLSDVAKEHADASDDASRAADRARAHLSRIVEGRSAQRMAVVRG